jgi:hypothetical protein
MRRFLPAAAGSLVVVLVGNWVLNSMVRLKPSGGISGSSAPLPSARPNGMPELIPIEATLFATSDQTLTRALARGALSDVEVWERLSALAEAGEADRLISCRLVCADGQSVEHAEAVREVPDLVGGRLEFHPARLMDPEYETMRLGHNLVVAVQWAGSHVRVEARLDSLEAAGDSRVEYFDARDPLSGETAELRAPRFLFLDMNVGADQPPGEPVLVAVTQDVAAAGSAALGCTRYLFLKAERPDWPRARELPPKPRAGWRVDEIVIDLPADMATDRLRARTDSRADGEWLQAALLDPRALLISVQRVSLTAPVFPEPDGGMDPTGYRAEVRSELSISEAANWDSTEGAPLERIGYGPALRIEAVMPDGLRSQRVRLGSGIDLPGRPREWQIFSDHSAPVIRTTSSRGSGFSSDVCLPTSGVRLVAAAPAPDHFAFGDSPPMQRLAFVRSQLHGDAETHSEPPERDEEVQCAVVSLPRDFGAALSDGRSDPERAARLVWDAVVEGSGRVIFLTSHTGNDTHLRSGVSRVWPCLDGSGGLQRPHPSGYMTRVQGLFWTLKKHQKEGGDPFAVAAPSSEESAPSLNIGFPVAPERHPVVTSLLAAIKEDSDPLYPESFVIDTGAIPLPQAVGSWALGSIQPANAPDDSPEHERWMAIVIRRIPGP